MAKGGTTGETFDGSLRVAAELLNVCYNAGEIVTMLKGPSKKRLVLFVLVPDDQDQSMDILCMTVHVNLHCRLINPCI